MAIQTINNGESGSAVRNKLNSNFSELSDAAVAEAANTLKLTPSGLTIGGQALTAGQKAQAAGGFGLLAPVVAKTLGPARCVFLGASITNGSSASNAGMTAYASLVGTTVNQRRVLRQTTSYGYPGQQPNFIKTQLPAALGANPDVLFLGPDFGTNGASNCIDGATLTTNYISHLLEILEGCRAAGVRLVVCMTMPQGSEQANANTHIGIRLQNAWLAQSGRKLGFDVIDTYTGMIDHATGYLAAAYYNPADPIHPNDAGHAALAAIIVGWINSNLPEIPWPVGVGVVGLNSNPLMLGGGTTPTGFAPTVFPATFAGVRTNSLENRVDAADLPVGRWYKVIADATASGAGILRTGTAAFAVTPGEQLIVFGYVKATGNATVAIDTWNVTATARHSVMLACPNDGVSRPFFSLITVPANCTSMRLILSITTTTGQSGTGYIGACDVIRPAMIPA